MSLEVRGLIIVGITAAVFGGAQRAARANLRSAAEVVAALGSALVVLDAWVLLSTTMPGEVGAAPALAGALLVSAAVLVPLGRVLTLAVASVVGLVGLTLAPTVLATATASVPGTALLLTASAALCALGLHPLVAHPPRTPGAIDLRHARTALTTLAPCYLALAALVTLATLVQVGPPQTLGPLLAMTAVCGLLAAFTPPDAGRRWSAGAGVCLVLAGTVGAWALIGSAPARALLWLLPVGALVGFAATVGILRALPRTGAAAARAGWVTVLTVGLPPVVATVVQLLAVMVAPSTGGAWRAALDLLPVCAGLGVLVVALPVLHRLGGDLISAPPAPEVSVDAVTLPRRSRVLIDHPLGASVLAATVLALGLPLLIPDARWAVAAQLAVATLAALASTRLPDRRGAPAIGDLTEPDRTRPDLTGSDLTGPDLTRPDPIGPNSIGPAAHPGPAEFFAPLPDLPLDERFEALVRGCVRACCVLAAGWAVITSVALAAGADSRASARAGLATVGVSFVVVGLILWVARGWRRAGAGDQGGTRAALAFASLVMSSVGAGTLAWVAVPLPFLGWFAAPLPLVLGLIALEAREARLVRAGRPGLSPGSVSDAHDRAASDHARSSLVPPSAVPPQPDPRSAHRFTRRSSADRVAGLGAAAALIVPAYIITATSALATTVSGPSVTVDLLATGLLGAAVVLVWHLSLSAGAPAQRWLRTTAGALVPVTGALALVSLRPVALAGNLAADAIDWPLLLLGFAVVVVTWAGAMPPDAGRRACEISATTLAAVTLLGVAGGADSGRVTLALSISAVGAFAYAVSARRPRWGWLGLGLGVCASWVSLSAADLPLEAYTAPGGVVVVAVGLRQLVRSLRSTAPGRQADQADHAEQAAQVAHAEQPAHAAQVAHAVRLLLAGLVVLVLPTVLLTPGAGAQGRAVVTLLAVLWLGGTARLVTLTAATVALRLRSLTVGMTVLALVGATLGLGGHSVALAVEVVSSRSGTGQTTPGPVLAMWLWTMTAALVTAALAVQLTSLRFPRSAPVSTHPGRLVADPRVWSIPTCTVLVTAPVTVLLVGGWFTTASAVVAAVMVMAWGLTALLGTPPGLPRVRSRAEFVLRAAPALVGTYAAALFGAHAAASSSGPGHVLVQLLTLAGVVVALVSVRAAQLAPASSTWSTVAFGAVATTAPLTVQMIAEPSGPWIAAATTVAAAWLVLGVRLRWQAPVTCGALALVVQVAVLAGPPALAVLSGMLGWMVLAAVGAALLALGLTYERQITTARKALHRYSELR